MQLLLFLLLFAPTCYGCLALDWRFVKNTAIACSVGYPIVSWYLWRKQQDNDVTLIASDNIIPCPPNVSLADSTCGESAIDTISGDGEQLLFVHADEANTTTAEPSNQSTAPLHINETTAATAATRSLPSLRANGTNVTIVASPVTPTEQLISPLCSKQQAMTTEWMTSNNPFIRSQGGLPATSCSDAPRTFSSRTPSTLYVSSCLAIVVLLVLYQLFVYGSSFHNWLHSLVQSTLAKIICLVIAAIDELPPYVTKATSSIVQASSSLLSRISKCFGFRPDRKNAISSETLLAFCRELGKLNSPRHRQTLGMKSIKSFGRKRRVSSWANYKHAAREFKAEHDHWHAIFEKGIADIHQQISNYTQLESRLKTRTAACAEVEESLLSHIKKLSDLIVKLEAQTTLVKVALPKSTDSLEDMKSLVRQINKLLQESKNTESQVKRAEGIIKTLYNVQSRMEMPPFTNTLKSVAEAGEKAQRIIYDAETAIVLAGMAHRQSGQLFESAVNTTDIAQLQPSPGLSPGVAAFDTVSSVDTSTLQHPPSPAIPAAAPLLDSAPRPLSLPISTSPSLPLTLLNPPHSPPSAKAVTPRRPPAPAPAPAPLPAAPSTPPKPTPRPPSPAPLSLSAEPSLTPQASQRSPNQRLAVPSLQTPSPPKKDDVPLSPTVGPKGKDMADAPSALAPHPSPTTAVDAVFLSAPAEPNDEKMAETTPAPASAPPDTIMEDAVPSSAVAELRDESMADAPSITAPPPTTTTVEDAARGRAWVESFGQMSRARQQVHAVKAVNAPPARSNRPVTFSTRIQDLRKLKPKVPTHRLNSPKQGILLQPAPSTPSEAEAPISAPPPTSDFEVNPLTLPTVAPVLTVAPVPRAAPPESKRINQAVYDQILLTGARKIKKPTSRLKKPAPVSIAPETTPVNDNYDDNFFPEYEGYAAFDKFFNECSGYDQSEDCTYSVENANNGDSIYPDPLAYNGHYGYDNNSAYNGNSAYNNDPIYTGYSAYKENNDEAYGSSNCVYPIGTEEVLSPIDEQLILCLNNYNPTDNPQVPVPSAPLDEVGRLLNSENNGLSHIDDCLLADRDDWGREENKDDRADYNSYYDSGAIYGDSSYLSNEDGYNSNQSQLAA